VDKLASVVIQKTVMKIEQKVILVSSLNWIYEWKAGILGNDSLMPMPTQMLPT
jgi:hypothetical protein